ncbi:hypothetical protein SGPA1_20797 [Streptomyces misionensis JCM 4497]
MLTVGDTMDAVTGTVTRTYPCAPGKPSPSTCYLTDAERLLEDLGPVHDGSWRCRGRPDSRAGAMLHEEESGSGPRVLAPATSWCSPTGWWPR